MIDAGLPIVQSLDILAHQATNKKFGTVLRRLKGDVESGSTLTQTLRKHPKVFDDLFVNMIAAGEGSGLLDTILQRLAAYMEKSQKLRAKITGAMLYPAAIVTAAAGVTTVLLVWVIPIFGELFSSFGQALPAPTQFVIELSDFTIAYFLYLVVGVVVLGLVLARAYQTESGRLGMEQLLLKFPVVGDLIRKSSIAALHGPWVPYCRRAYPSSMPCQSPQRPPGTGSSSSPSSSRARASAKERRSPSR